MNFTGKLLKKLNSFFRVPKHPLFDLHEGSDKSYAKWQFTKGDETIKYFLSYTSADDMFRDKTVIDIGCGAAGKTLYFASLGVKHIYGVDLLENYKPGAEVMAEELQLSDKFTFVTNDAIKLPFDDTSIDTIIMNDTMEHVDFPESILLECLRVLARGGRIFMTFPTYYHPYGSHLQDAIAMPWAHLLFSEKTMVSVYKDMVKDLPNGAKRIKFRISECGEKVAYINKMTVRRFNKILKQLELDPVYYKELPLRKKLMLLAKIPFIKECFLHMVVCVIQKD